VLLVSRRRRQFVAGLPVKESERVQSGMPEALANRLTSMLAHNSSST
jgi:hypothetical protein